MSIHQFEIEAVVPFGVEDDSSLIVILIVNGAKSFLVGRNNEVSFLEKYRSVIGIPQFEKSVKVPIIRGDRKLGAVLVGAKHFDIFTHGVEAGLSLVDFY